MQPKQFIEIIATVGRQRNIPALMPVSAYDTYPVGAKCGFEMIEWPDLAEKQSRTGRRPEYHAKASLSRSIPRDS